MNLRTDKPADHPTGVGEQGQEKYYQVGPGKGVRPDDVHIRWQNARETLAQKKRGEDQPVWQLREDQVLHLVNIEHKGGEAPNYQHKGGNDQQQTQEVFTHKAVASGTFKIIVIPVAFLPEAQLLQAYPTSFFLLFCHSPLLWEIGRPKVR